MKICFDVVVLCNIWCLRTEDHVNICVFQLLDRQIQNSSIIYKVTNCIFSRIISVCCVSYASCGSPVWRVLLVCFTQGYPAHSTNYLPCFVYFMHSTVFCLPYADYIFVYLIHIPYSNYLGLTYFVIPHLALIYIIHVMSTLFILLILSTLYSLPCAIYPVLSTCHYLSHGARYP